MSCLFCVLEIRLGEDRPGDEAKAGEQSFEKHGKIEAASPVEARVYVACGCLPAVRLTTYAGFLGPS